MKTIFGFIRILFFLLVLALIFHNLTARMALTYYLRWNLGTPVEVEAARVDLMGTQAVFYNIVVRNPTTVPDGVLATIPELFVDLDAQALMDGHLYFKKVAVEVSELTLSRAHDGQSNLFALKVMKPAALDSPRKKGFKIDHFILTLRRGIFMDLSMTNPMLSRQVYELNLQGQDYLSVRTLEDVVKIISWESLKRMRMEQLGAGILDQVRQDLEGG